MRRHGSWRGRATLALSLVFALAVWASPAGGPDEHVVDIASGRRPGEWMTLKAAEGIDLSCADGVAFDFFCDNLERFERFSLQLLTSEEPSRCGFVIQFQPYESGRWHEIRLRKSEVTTRLRPGESWADVRAIRLVGKQGEGSGAARVGIANLRPLRPKGVVALVVLGEFGIARDGSGQWPAWCAGYVRRNQEAFDILGLGNVAMADVDLARKGVPDGVKLLSFPMNAALPEGMCDVLADFTAHGGRILWQRRVPDEARGLLRNNPKSCVDAGHSLEVNANCDVVAYAQRLRPVVEGLLPDLSREMKRALATRAEKDEKIVQRICAMPSVPGEVRILDSRTPYGLWPDEGLAKTAKMAKAWGFTALDVNVCCGPVAWYDSKVLHAAGEVAVHGDAVRQLVEACRANGLKSVAWRCCFRVKGLPAAVDEAYSKAGRFSVGRDLVQDKGFLCPVNPLNRQEDVEAFAELARTGLDAVEMDFIRYSGGGHCCCNACRKAFEEKLGTPVQNWPEDVFRGEKDGGLERQWRAFRVEAITSHIRDVRAAVKAANPRVELWSTCFQDVSIAYTVEAQDMVGWCREGLVDRLGFMDYTFTPAGFGGLIATHRIHDFGSFAAFAPIWGDVRWRGARTVAEKAWFAAKHIEAIRGQGYKSFCFFSETDETKSILDILAKGPLKTAVKDRP